MSLRKLLDSSLSPLTVPTVYFDTQIISRVANGTIDQSRWSRTIEFIERNAQHGVSLTTMYELLAAVAYGSDRDFPQNRDRFRVLKITPQQSFLPLVGDFLRVRLFHLPPRRLNFDPKALADWVPVILKANHRAELTSGNIVFAPNAPVRFGIDLRMVQRQVLKGKAAYIRRLKHLRISHPDPLPTDHWAAAYVRNLGLLDTAETRARLEAALGAVYEHDVAVRNKASATNYNFKKHQSDWLDSQQLHYLAEPTFIFVTDDQPLREAVKASSQAQRVISFAELEQLACP